MARIAPWCSPVALPLHPPPNPTPAPSSILSSRIFLPPSCPLTYALPTGVSLLNLPSILPPGSIVSCLLLIRCFLFAHPRLRYMYIGNVVSYFFFFFYKGITVNVVKVNSLTLKYVDYEFLCSKTRLVSPLKYYRKFWIFYKLLQVTDSVYCS